MKGWYSYMRQIRSTLAQTPEGCTMSETQGLLAHVTRENSRQHYEQLLGLLCEHVRDYQRARKESRKCWQCAESTAAAARMEDKKAAAALRESVKLVKELGGCDAANALKQLAALDQRSADGGGTFTDEAEASAAAEVWDPDDQVTLAELHEEEPGNGD